VPKTDDDVAMLWLLPKLDNNCNSLTTITAFTELHRPTVILINILFCYHITWSGCFGL